MNLDEIFPNGRGDGRKFTFAGWEPDRWYEPIFRCRSYWLGLDPYNGSGTYKPDGPWSEWHQPKRKKTITLYRTTYRCDHNGLWFWQTHWQSTHSKSQDVNNVVVEIEEKNIEVDDY